jgi:hypothetical protein
VSLKDILREGFSKGIRNLILGSYWEDLHKPVPYVGGGIDKNLRKNISSNINLKYGSCRYMHAE